MKSLHFYIIDQTPENLLEECEKWEVGWYAEYPLTQSYFLPCLIYGFQGCTERHIIHFRAFRANMIVRRIELTRKNTLLN